MGDQEEQREVYRLLQEIMAKLYTLATREELALYVTEKVFYSEINNIKHSIEEAKKHPEIMRSNIALLVSIVLAIFTIATYWRH
jgi:hypothetical protein